jgi:endonuclease YncB( thermonuclease family)
VNFGEPFLGDGVSSSEVEVGVSASRACVGVFAALILVLVGSDSSWTMSPRYELYDTAQVVSVESPNLLRLKLFDRGREVSVRLLGVGSPRNRDRVRDLDPRVIYYIRNNDVWEASKHYVKSLLKGRKVQVWARKWNRLDEKNRLLVYLVVPNSSQDSLDVNGQIISSGLGFVTRDYVHVSFVKYRRLEKLARKHRRGMWQALSRKRLSSLPQ